MKIGDKVYLRPQNNKARYGNVEIKECEIKSVGRKYFEVWDDDKRWVIAKFHIAEDRRQVTDYSPDWKVYLSKQELIDEVEFGKLETEIKKIFSGYGKVNLSLEQLRDIKKIIN